MLRRRIGHDYSSRCIYLVTMTTEGRRPLLGTLVGNAEAPAGSTEAPHIVLTPLGERVRQAWMANETHYQGVSVLATMVMPDHLHGILFIREEATVDLGTIIKGRFLILAPWPHNNRETPLTRQMCLELNEMAKEICEG